ncbi:MAG: thioredoxin family protein [Rhodobacteraceae bacterium]|nr:thioredoxin family protein [Paracoccaceae bacterium]
MAFALSTLLFGPVRAETILIMFEDQGCPYCERWKAEIGPIYPKTSEAEIAPLMIIDVDDPLPAGISIVSKPIYTPTFVLIHNGQEIDRLLGYPGEDFFWFLVDRMLLKLPEQTSEGS